MKASNERLIFGKPILYTTELFYPEKINLEKFCNHILESISGYKENMDYLNSSEKYIEEWFESFGGWMEIEER